MPAQDYSELNARVQQTWCVPRTDKPPAGPHLGTVPTTSVPDGQGQRSIQVDGLRVPCVSLQTPGDRHGLDFGAGDKQGRPRYHIDINMMI